MKRRTIFPLLLAAVPVVILGSMELGARRLHAPGDADAFLDFGQHLDRDLLGHRRLLMNPSVRFDMLEGGGAQVLHGCHGLVETNALGMRMRDVAAAKPDGVLRVACLGDSVTFGWCVREEESYPRQLEGLLRQAIGPRVEVLNFGVPGSTSTKGVTIARDVVVSMRPDVAIVAYGFNDSAFIRWGKVSGGAILAARRLLRQSALYRTLLRLRPEAAPEPALPPRQTPPSQLRYNLFLLVTELRRAGAQVVLADLTLPNLYPRRVYETVAANQRAPLVRGRELFMAEVPPPRVESLTPAGPAPAARREILFRVRAQGASAPSVVGEIPELSAMVPGKLRMRDDGTEGDERAGDGVFSLLVGLPGPLSQPVDYTFVPPFPEGSWGRPEMISTPSPASFYVYHRVVAAPGRTVTPVHVVAEIPYQSHAVELDSVHPNARGMEIIARALATAVQSVVRTPAERP